MRLTSLDACGTLLRRFKKSVRYGSGWDCDSLWQAVNGRLSLNIDSLPFGICHSERKLRSSAATAVNHRIFFATTQRSQREEVRAPFRRASDWPMAHALGT
jgi:hypothetical protein